MWLPSLKNQQPGIAPEKSENGWLEYYIVSFLGRRIPYQKQPFHIAKSTIDNIHTVYIPRILY